MKDAGMRAQGKKSANKENNKYAQFNMGSKAKGDQKTRQVAQRKKKLDRMGLEKTADGKKYKAQDVEGPRIGAANNNDGGWVNGKMTAAPLLRGEKPLPSFNFKVQQALNLPEDTAMLEF